MLPAATVVSGDTARQSCAVSHHTSTEPSPHVSTAVAARRDADLRTIVTRPSIIRQPQDVWPKVSIEQCNAALIAIGTKERMQYLCRAILFGNKASMANFPPLAPKSKYALSPPLHWLGVVSCEVAVVNIFVFQRLLSKLEQRGQLLVAKDIEVPLSRLLRKNQKKLNAHRPSIIPQAQLSPIDSVTNNLITRAKELAMDPTTRMSALHRAGLHVAENHSISGLGSSPEKSAIILPLPLNAKTKEYTKAEAAVILFSTAAGSRARGTTMKQMIASGYTPASRTTHRRIMQKRDEGKAVENTPWVVTKSTKAKPKEDGGCNGIQSQILDKHGKDNMMYCFRLGWYTNGESRHWHAGGCSSKNVDKNGRCNHCRSVYTNMNKERHPVFFKDNQMPTPIQTPSSVPMMHEKSTIGSLVAKRITEVQEMDILNDKTLADAALLLHVKKVDGVEIGGNKMFIVCHECKTGRVCQKRLNNACLCVKCSTKSSVKKWQEDRRKHHSEEKSIVVRSVGVAIKFCGTRDDIGKSGPHHDDVAVTPRLHDVRSCNHSPAPSQGSNTRSNPGSSVKSGSRKRQWREEEDAFLLRAIFASGSDNGSSAGSEPRPPLTNWTGIASKLPGWTGKQIRARWVNFLDPAINHDPFSREDDLLLWRGHKEIGNRWVEISDKIFHSTRSVNHLKNRWYSAAFKKIIAKEFGMDAYADAKQAQGGAVRSVGSSVQHTQGGIWV